MEHSLESARSLWSLQLQVNNSLLADNPEVPGRLVVIEIAQCFEGDTGGALFERGPGIGEVCQKIIELSDREAAGLGRVEVALQPFDLPAVCICGP